MRQINLLPEEVKRTQLINPIKNSLLIAGAVILTVTVTTYGLMESYIKKITVINNRINIKQVKKISPDSKLTEKFKTLKNQKIRFLRDNSFLIKALSKRFNYAAFLKDISFSANDKVWLSSISLNTDAGNCVLEGKSFNSQKVSEFLFALKKSVYVKDIELTFMKRNGQSDDSVVTFKVVCNFK